MKIRDISFLSCVPVHTDITGDWRVSKEHMDLFLLHFRNSFEIITVNYVKL